MSFLIYYVSLINNGKIKNFHIMNLEKKIWKISYYSFLLIFQFFKYLNINKYQKYKKCNIFW